jgi:S-adenosylmethionine synthetase
VDQSADHEQGAGDQGMMFGFACRETEVLMPFPIAYAHRLIENLTKLRTEGTLPYLRPDAKSQITTEYEGQKPVRIHTVLISTQHTPDVDAEQIKADLREHLLKPTLPEGMVDDGLKFLVNPTGRFVVGGPHGDTGLTGRKIIVDTYGGRGSHGGGCFSGKDPSKVDRSASYAARHVAKNIVSADIAERCEVQISYAIGVARPLSINVCTEGTGKIPEERIEEIVAEHFDLRPAAIIDYYKLRRPIYKHTARHGHFGHDDDLYTWEKTEKADDLRNAAGL